MGSNTNKMDQYIENLTLDDTQTVLRGTFNNKGAIPTCTIKTGLEYIIQSHYPGFHYVIINHVDYCNFIIWPQTKKHFQNIFYIKHLQAQMYDYFAFKVRGDCSLNIYPNFKFKINLCNFRLKTVNRLNSNIILEFITRNKTINNEIISSDHNCIDMFNRIIVHE